MSVIQAAILGVVQGLTEFLPVSSKTHLVVVPALAGWDPPSLEFLVLLHLGTFVGLVLYIAPTLWNLAKGAFGRDAATTSESRATILNVAIATVPVAVVGFVFRDTFETLLSDPIGAAFALVATALILALTEWTARKRSRSGEGRAVQEMQRGETRSEGGDAGRATIRTSDAIRVGLGQVLALLPGVSRSGVTIASGIMSGVKRESAARFSFLMSLPAIAGANFLVLPDAIRQGISTPEIVGILTAGISGYLAAALLLRLVSRYSLTGFAIYCAIAGPLAGLILIIR